MHEPPENRFVHILLIEDNRGDIRLAQEALSDARLLNELHVVHDGHAALEFLRREGEYGAAPRPDLVLLDLNIPGIDGREVLDSIKTDEKLAGIPVIVLTTSDSQVDVLQSYEARANSYITKPEDLPQFLEMIRAIEAFWFTTVRLPSKNEDAA